MRAIIKDEVAIHFNGPRNEHGRFDLYGDLAMVACSVLMIGGEHTTPSLPSLSRRARCPLIWSASNGWQTAGTQFMAMIRTQSFLLSVSSLQISYP